MKMEAVLADAGAGGLICSAGRGSQPAAPYIIGADISWSSATRRGGRFSDQGSEKEIVEIVKDHGLNWIRLRIFCNPQAEKGFSQKGYRDLEHTLQMAKRVRRPE